MQDEQQEEAEVQPLGARDESKSQEAGNTPNDFPAVAFTQALLFRFPRAHFLKQTRYFSPTDSPEEP